MRVEDLRRDDWSSIWEGCGEGVSSPLRVGFGEGRKKCKLHADNISFVSCIFFVVNLITKFEDVLEPKQLN